MHQMNNNVFKSLGDLELIRNPSFDVEGVCNCHPKRQRLAIVYPFTSYVCMNCYGVKQ